MTMVNKLAIGDLVWNTMTGVRGHILKFYTPTASEPQILIETDDNKGQYHAPESTWKLYPGQNHYGYRADRVIYDEMVGPNTMFASEEGFGTLNVHGGYVIEFAKNHGISINEAYQHPMVKAHQEFCEAMGLQNFPQVEFDKLVKPSLQSAYFKTFVDGKDE